VLGGLLYVPPLEQQKRDAVVRAAEAVVQLQGALVVANGLLGLTGLGEGDGHVEQDARVGGIVPEGEPVRCQCGLEVALTLQCQALVEIVEPLGTQVSPGSLAEHALPEGHRDKKV
jgi:hypothetical protein